MAPGVSEDSDRPLACFEEAFGSLFGGCRVGGLGFRAVSGLGYWDSLGA